MMAVPQGAAAVPVAVAVVASAQAKKRAAPFGATLLDAVDTIRSEP
jgi:hypothetical protein